LKISQRRIVRELAACLLVAFLALLILPIAGVQVGNNTSRWLTEASHIVKETGVGSGIQSELMARRPLFPLIIAGGFKLWGKSVHSAVLVTRIFFALELVLIYFIGRIFFNIAVGLLSSAFVMTSYGINLIAKTVDTDIVHPFFILLFVLIYYLALRRESWVLSLLSGVCLGLAILIKETAIFCLVVPLGIVIFAPKGKRWPHGKTFLWLLTALIVPLLIWAAYLFIHKSSIKGLLDNAYAAATYRISGGGGLLAKWKFLFTTGLAKSVSGYYHAFLLKISSLAVFMVLGWAFICVRGVIKKKLSDLTLGILIICALPILLQLGYEGDRLGQMTIVYMVLYIAFAAFVFSAMSWLVQQGRKLIAKKKKDEVVAPQTPKKALYTAYVLTALVGIVMAGTQLFSKDLSTWKLWTEPGDALAIFVKKPFEVYGRFTSFQEDAAAWLKNNSKPETKIIADGYTNEALDFFDVAATKIPVIHPVREILISANPPAIQEKTRPLFLFTYSNFDSGIDRARGLYAVFESDILAVLKAENPRYLVLSGRSLYLKTYFEKASWSRLVFNNQRVVVYEIRADQAGPISFQQVGVNEEFNDHAAWLEKNHPDEYPNFLKTIAALNLTLDEIKKSPLLLPKGQTY